MICKVCGGEGCAPEKHVIDDLEERTAVEDAVARAREAEAEAWRQAADRAALVDVQDTWRAYAMAAIRGMTSRPYTVSREVAEHAAILADAMVAAERERFGS